MGPKKKISETDEQIIKQGCLIKSPPSYIFNKKASWKGRLLKLCRTGAGTFILRYYAYDGVSEDWKGDIYLSDIKSIELGKNTMERIPTITRLFNNSPNEILCIKTAKRDFYLVDDSAENIAEWQKYLTDAWEKIQQKVTIEGPTSPSANLLKIIQDQEDVTRPKSYPEDYPRTETASVEGLNRVRSHTDPEDRQRNLLTLDDYKESRDRISLEEKDIFSNRWDSKMLSICCQIPSDKTHHPREERRHSASALLQANPEDCRLSDDMTDRAYDSEPDSESIYDIPRSIPVKINESQDPATEREETSDLDLEEYGVYERMSSLCIDEATNLPPKPPRNFNITPLNRYSKTQRSQLKKAQILKMMYELHSHCDLVSINLTVPTEHLKNYLSIQEVGERLCVSKWKGPLHIGCLFHHGDQIESINEFRPGSIDLFFQMLSNSISNEVHLVLTRNKRAAVFHLEGCSCGSS